MPRYKQMPMHPSQIMLFSQSVEDALPADSDVRGFKEVIECLDYSSLEAKCSQRGCPPYPPSVMAKILGYAYSKGIRSSREIENLLYVDVRFIWLAGGLRPDHNTIARFRKENWEEFRELFKDSVRVCAEAGLVSLDVVATDGTKISAAASKRRVYSKARIERELEKVESILREAEEVDKAEDEHYGGGSVHRMPERLRDAKERKARLLEIADRLKESKKKTCVETDPDSRVMLTGDGKRPCYNLQASVDAANQIIVAARLTQAENDCGQLPGMVEEIESNTGDTPDASVVDSGYSDEATLAWMEENNHNVLMPLKEHPRESERVDLFASRCFLPDDDQDALICPAGRKLAFKGIYRTGSGHYRQYSATGCKSCSFHSQCVGKGNHSRRVSISVVSHVRAKLKEKLNTQAGRKLYSLRQETVEPVFGQMKSNRGMNRFLCWGYEGASAESALMCIAHNVMKCAAFGAKKALQTALKAPRSLTRPALVSETLLFRRLSYYIRTVLCSSLRLCTHYF